MSEELKQGIYHIQVIDINVDMFGEKTIEFKILDSEEPDRIYNIKLDEY